MSSSKDAIREALDNMGDTHPPEVKEKIEKLTKDIYEGGMSPQEAMGMSDSMVEGMYSFAYRLYNLGKYDQAVQLFRLLIMINPTETRFLLGIAACYHMMKNYDNAASSYMLCSVVDPEDPVPYFHASDCFIALGNWGLAEHALKLCITNSSDDDEYEQLKKRAEVALEGIKNKISPQKGNEQTPKKKTKIKKKKA